MKNSQKKQEKTSENNTYSKPELSVFGSITEMTNANDLTNANDSSGGGGAGTKGSS